MKKFNLDSDGLDLIFQAAIEAGSEIMEIYSSADFGVESKSDQSPLTKADKAAHHKIVEILYGTGIPILSEEGLQSSFEERSEWDEYWLIDPLDGTKEFIKQNGEFTVNIALIEKGVPVFGVVYAPVLDKLYMGGTKVGFSKLWSENRSKEIELKRSSFTSLEELRNAKDSRVVASRSHRNEATENFINSLNGPNIVSMGSSLKFMVLAEGTADVYPRFAPTMEWDTAAAHAILNQLGFKILQVKNNSEVSEKEIEYNKENLLNPWFLVY